ncbi:MAG: NUDIX domain-containing protein [Gemmatimonadales bacterium]
MPPRSVRPLSIALIRRAEEILVMAVRGHQGQIKGWRPPGGGIEFGESAEQALVREISEELNQPICCREQICVLENMFLYEGHPGHEIVFVFEVEFENQSAYATDGYAYIDQGIENDVVWKRATEFQNSSEQLFPEGLLEYL